jgi:hypothetical protein
VTFLRGRIKELEEQEAASAAERAARDEKCTRPEWQRAGKYRPQTFSYRSCLLLTLVSTEAEAERTLMLEEVAHLTAASDEAKKCAETLASELEGK